MIRKIYLVAVTCLIISACGKSSKQNETENTGEIAESKSESVNEENKSYFVKEGIIAIEAEAYTEQIIPDDPELSDLKWVLSDSVAGFGGKGYLTSDYKRRPDGILPFGKGACVTYEIEVEEAGEYYTGFRGYAPVHGSPGAHDSIFLTVNDQEVPRTSFKGSAYPAVWHWAFSDEDVPAEFTIDLPKGKCTIQMYIREPGTLVDQIVLVKSKSYMPEDDQQPLDI